MQRHDPTFRCCCPTMCTTAELVRSSATRNDDRPVSQRENGLPDALSSPRACSPPGSGSDSESSCRAPACRGQVIAAPCSLPCPSLLRGEGIADRMPTSALGGVSRGEDGLKPLTVR